MVGSKETDATPKQEPLGVRSVEDLAKTYADELRTPSAQPCILQFLRHVSKLSTVEGVALAVSQAQHLSVYAFTELNRSDPQSRRAVASVGRISGALDKAMRLSNPRLSCGLSFVNTRGSSADILMSELRERLSADQTVSIIAFAQFDH